MAHTLDQDEVPIGHTRWSRLRPGTFQNDWLHKILRNDCGAVSADLVLITPLVLLLLLTIVQFVLWSHATHTAQAAATQGLAVARAQNGSADAGSASARQLLDQLARGPLTQASVTAQRGTESASVRITGTARSVVPFLRLPVRAEATGPVERFVPEIGGLTSP